MADVELVIKIPEELKNNINEDNYRTLIWWYDTTLYLAIKHGNPLPKGHGDLIDESDLIPDSDYEDGMFYAVSIEQINNAPTIIEADKEEQE